MTPITFTHPYAKYENSDLWNTLQQAVTDLVENQDLMLQTREEYVIGYICKALACKYPDISRKSNPDSK
jgi:hypothetical protein